MSEHKERIRQIFRVVCVVEDLDTALENWKTMVQFDYDSVITGRIGSQTKCFYQGAEISCPVRFADFDLGGIQMRLVEPENKTGGDPFADALIKRGPGFHHLSVYADDRKEMIEYYKTLGIEPVFQAETEQGRYMLFDFESSTGLSIVPEERMEGPCAR